MSRVDLTMDSMANNKFLTVYNSLIKNFTASTDFTHNEIVSLLVVYYKFTMKNASRLMSTRQLYQLFLVMFGIFDVNIIDRISLNFTADGRYVAADSWIRMFRIFLTGNLEERMRFTFDVYTSAGAVTLNREVVGLAIEKFFFGDDDDEVNELRAVSGSKEYSNFNICGFIGAQDMVEFIFGKFDLDKDSIISYDEYSEIVTRQPGLLEFLGKIFPDNGDVALIAYCHNIESLFPPDD
ncbi:hypothetical protein KR018_005631 [Drosophila ironensis]|nr:hypothetical protein KR018_005631 [Drosophila ironensis]